MVKSLWEEFGWIFCLNKNQMRTSILPALIHGFMKLVFVFAHSFALLHAWFLFVIFRWFSILFCRPKRWASGVFGVLEPMVQPITHYDQSNFSVCFRIFRPMIFCCCSSSSSSHCYCCWLCFRHRFRRRIRIIEFE